MSGGGVRVSIPSGVRKMIQDIKEIMGNHSEDEIYAMLKECSMDPDETAHKLLLQDTFHEVKRKRDRRKESMNNRESGDSRWRPRIQGRGSRSGRANFAPRHTSHDAASGRNSGGVKHGVTSQAVEKGVGPSLPVSEEKGEQATLSVSSAVEANDPYGVPEIASATSASNLPAGTGANQQEVVSSPIDVSKVESVASSIDATKSSTSAFEAGDVQVEPIPASSNSSVSLTPKSSSTVCFSSSDPVLLPSNDSRLPGMVGTIKREVGSHRISGELNAVVPAEESVAESGITSFPQGKMPNKFQGVGKSQLNESSQSSSASIHGASGSRPSSNYGSRSQQIIGPQKVGSNKEWKPKSTNPNVLQGSSTVVSSEVTNVPVESSAQSRAITSVLDSEEATSKLQKKLEELHLPQRQHVIIPNHIHVPESERTKFSFGSFDSNFGVTSTHVSGPESDKSSTPPSETSQGVEETVGEQNVSNENPLVTAEGAFPDHPQSPTHAPGNLSGEADVSSGSVVDYKESKQENVLLSGGHQYSVVQTSPSYNFGFVPAMLGSQVAPIETEPQARDVSRLPNFIVQQPFDPASYYAQFYRSGADGDGRVSPFPSPGVASKYNGNVSVLPPQTSPSPQEGGNSLGMHTGGPTSMVTQAAGLTQSSIAVNQQPIPVFRPPTGLHISHYPPNYIPYGHYFSPFYVPPPGLHQFLGNGTFPQQPQAGSVYPAPPAASATGVKFSLPQYKSGNTAGNSTHIGMPSGYGTYGSSPAGYNPSSAATANSNANEDLGASQFKESNVYITGQQSEGSAMWIAAPGRDISSLPASSFYSLPPQGQHVTFAPTQAGHGTFTSLYHPAQAVTAAAVHPLLQQSQTMAGAVDIVGPATSVYQHPQHQQINWPSNY